MKAKSKTKAGKYMGSAKVGPKGQIVIPKEVREMFDIEPGDTLVILADSTKGIAIERYNTFAKIADAIFAGKSKEIYPDETEENAIAFAEAIKEVGETGEARKAGETVETGEVREVVETGKVREDGKN